MYANRNRKANRSVPTFAEDQDFKKRSPIAKRSSSISAAFGTPSVPRSVYDPIVFPFVGPNPIIDVVRQAVSIDERRCFYQDNLFGKPERQQDIRQVWFSGVHSDVGGSYPEKDGALSKIPFEWMFVEAAKAGLALDPAKVETVLGLANAFPHIKGLPNYVQGDPNGQLHKSLYGPWWIIELLPQRDPHRNGRGWNIPLGRRRTIPAGSFIHECVLESKWQPTILLDHYQVEPWTKFCPESKPVEMYAYSHSGAD